MAGSGKITAITQLPTVKGTGKVQKGSGCAGFDALKAGTELPVNCQGCTLKLKQRLAAEQNNQGNNVKTQSRRETPTNIKSKPASTGVDD